MVDAGAMKRAGFNCGLRIADLGLRIEKETYLAGAPTPKSPPERGPSYSRCIANNHHKSPLSGGVPRRPAPA